MDTANVDIKVIGTYEGEAAQSPMLSKEEQAKFMLDKYKKLINEWGSYLLPLPLLFTINYYNK